MPTKLFFVENALHAGFVSPNLCKDLLTAGVTYNAQYRWKIYNNREASLTTNIFDLDDYYVAGERQIDMMYPPISVLPAFTIKDIERCLPPYFLSRTDKNIYQVSLDHLYNTDTVGSQRLPDAFALILLESIRKRIVDLKVINQYSK